MIETLKTFIITFSQMPYKYIIYNSLKLLDYIKLKL